MLKPHASWIIALLAVSSIGLASPRNAVAAEPAAAESGVEAELMQAERARIQAMVSGDAAGLSHAVGDELVFGHGSGGVQNKAEFVKAFGDNHLHIQSIDVTEQSARIYGDVGVTHGRQTLHFASGMVLQDRYMGVYVRRDGRWQLIGWQSTPIPDHASQDHANTEHK